MTTPKLKTLVAKAVELDRQIREDTQKLKDIKKDLIAEAASREEEQHPTEGGGRSIAFDGLSGEIARVTFPARSLKEKIDGEGKPFAKIAGLCRTGLKLGCLFEPVTAFRPVPNFRDKAVDILGPRGGKALIRVCESDSTPKVAFETKKEEAA